MVDPQIPRAVDVLGAGKDALIAVRPHTKRFLTVGRYADVMAGWRAQYQLVLRRLAHEALCSRLVVDGKPLLDLLASEFDAAVDPAPQHAIGTVRLLRNKTGPTGFTGGLIRQGTKFRRPADATATPPAREALYESTEPVYVGSSYQVATPPLTGYVQYITVPVRAVLPGSAANIVRTHGAAIASDTTAPMVVADSLFDTFTVDYADAAGGSDGPPVAKLRALGTALGTGQYAPNLAAIAAGLLMTNGVAHVAVTEDTTTGKVLAWAADESWAWSTRLRDRALQNLNDRWLGFGCAASLGVVSNYNVSVSLALTLRDKRHLADGSAITEKVRKAILAYFNDRPDWYTWRIDRVIGEAMRADRRILDVQEALVKNADGNMDEPAAALPASVAAPIYHYNVDEGSITTLLYAPS